MSKTTMNIAKNVGIGLVAGSAAIAVSSAVMHKKGSNSTMKNMKKSAGKAVHTMTEIMNSVETMLK